MCGTANAVPTAGHAATANPHKHPTTTVTARRRPPLADPDRNPPQKLIEPTSNRPRHDLAPPNRPSLPHPLTSPPITASTAVTRATHVNPKPTRSPVLI